MMRRSLLFLSLLLPAPAAAQQLVRMAPNVDLAVWYPAPWTLAAFPTWWRDSVRSAFTHAIPHRATAVAPEPTHGSAATLSIQMLRSGVLHKVRLDPGTGNATIDSALVDAVRIASAAGAFPPFPPGVDGAGREVRLVAYIPIDHTDRPVGPWHGGFDGPPLSAACDSSVAANVKWRPGTLVAEVDSTSAGSGMAAWAERVLPSLADAYVDVGPIAAPQHPTVFEEHPVDPVFSGMLHLVLTSVGRVRSSQLLVATGVPRLDTALTALVARADSQQLIPPPPSTRGDTATLDIAIGVALGYIPNSVLIGPLKVGVWALDASPQMRHLGPTRYPRDLRDRGIAGVVTVEYVIAPDGTADLGSVTVRSSPDPGFSRASFDIVKGSRFVPGRIGSCAVPVHVAQHVRFEPDRPLVRRDMMTSRPAP